VDIRHGHGVLDDARQEGDIGHLFQCLLFPCHLQEFLRCEDESRNPHSRFVVLGKQPAVVVQLLNKTLPAPRGSDLGDLGVTFFFHLTTP